MHKIEVAAASALSRLGAAIHPHPADSDQHVVPGIYFSWDQSGCKVDVRVLRTVDAVLAFSSKVSGRPEWFTLNIELGEDALAPGDVLGIVADIASDAPATLPLFVRSATGGGIEDTILAENLHATKDGVISTVLHTISSGDALATQSAFHTMVIDLSGTNHNTEIRDLRIFAIPADQARKSSPNMVSSASA